MRRPVRPVRSVRPARYFLLHSIARANTTIAEVNGKSISLGHIIAAVSKLPKEYDNLDTDYLLNGILDQIIKQEIMAQTLDFNAPIVKATIENEIRSAKAKYAVEEFMQDFPTQAMLQTAYEKALSSLKNIEEFNASHILLEDKESALEILKSLELGKEFSTLAQEKSTGPSGSNGGQLGWFGSGQMVPEFETAVMVLEIGMVSQPVQTQFGWHVIKLNDRRLKPVPTLEEMKPELIQQLSQERIDEIVRSNTEKATLKLFLDNIESSSIRNLKLLQ